MELKPKEWESGKGACVREEEEERRGWGAIKKEGGRGETEVERNPREK